MLTRTSTGRHRGLTRRLEEAAQASRALRDGYLQGAVEAVLLEGRKYRKKTILGEPRIRAEITAEGAGPVPVYLPASIAASLPLFARFRAKRVIELTVAERGGRPVVAGVVDGDDLSERRVRHLGKGLLDQPANIAFLVERRDHNGNTHEYEPCRCAANGR